MHISAAVGLPCAASEPCGERDSLTELLHAICRFHSGTRELFIPVGISTSVFGRGARIRTGDLYTPSVAP